MRVTDSREMRMYAHSDVHVGRVYVCPSGDDIDDEDFEYACDVVVSDGQALDGEEAHEYRLRCTAPLPSRAHRIALNMASTLERMRSLLTRAQDRGYE